MLSQVVFWGYCFILVTCIFVLSQLLKKNTTMIAVVVLIVSSGLIMAVPYSGERQVISRNTSEQTSVWYFQSEYQILKVSSINPFLSNKNDRLKIHLEIADPYTGSSRVLIKWEHQDWETMTFPDGETVQSQTTTLESIIPALSCQGHYCSALIRQEPVDRKMRFRTIRSTRGNSARENSMWFGTDLAIFRGLPDTFTGDLADSSLIFWFD